MSFVYRKRVTYDGKRYGVGTYASQRALQSAINSFLEEAPLCSTHEERVVLAEEMKAEAKAVLTIELKVLQPTSLRSHPGHVWMIWEDEKTAYWNSKGDGYVTDIDMAGRFSAEDAIHYLKHSNPGKYFKDTGTMSGSLKLAPEARSNSSNTTLPNQK